MYPVDVEFTPDGRRLLLTTQWSGLLQVFSITEGALVLEGEVSVGFDPAGMAITSSGDRVYIGQVANAKVAEVDLESLTITRRLTAGQWPRYLTLSPDDRRLAIGNGGDSNISVLDTVTGETLYEEPLANGNLGQMRTSADGKYA